MMKYDTNDVRSSSDRYSSLGGLMSGLNNNNLGQIATTQRLSNSNSKTLIQSASYNYINFIKQKNYANELAENER